MGSNWLYTGNYGAGAKEANAAIDANRKDWRDGAWGTFSDEKDSDAFKADLDARMSAIAGRKAPTVAAPEWGPGAFTKAATVGPATKAAGTTIARGPELAMRARQQAALGMFADAAAGRGPSVAGAQMTAGVDQTLAAQSAALGSGPRTGAALGMRAAMLGGNQALGGAAAQSAATKMQEANAGAQQFAQLSSGMRQADIGAALAQAKLDQETGLTNAGAENAATMANAGFAQQAGMFNAQAWQSEAEMRQRAELANVEAALRARGMNDAAINSYLAAYQKQFQADKAAKMAFWGMAQDNAQFDERMLSARQQQDMQADAAKNAALGSLITLGMGAGGGKKGG